MAASVAAKKKNKKNKKRKKEITKKIKENTRDDYPFSHHAPMRSTSPSLPTRLFSQFVFPFRRCSRCSIGRG